MITLTGDKTTIKGTDSSIYLGIIAKDSATFQMTGGSITASNTGAYFSKNKESKLENVTISSDKNDAPLLVGVEANQSTVTLQNVNVKQTHNAIVADNNSTITVSGGSFETDGATIYAQNGSNITLTNDAQITSSDGNGLYAKDENSQITMVGGTVAAKNTHFALYAEEKGLIDATNVTLTTDDEETGAFAFGLKSRIELRGNTIIKNTFDDLEAIDGGKITGGKTINTAPHNAAHWCTDQRF